MTVLIWPFFDVEVLSPSSSSSPSPPEHQKVHHNSASNDPRLLKFCVHLPYGITPGCFWIYCDRTSGCRPCLQKLIYDHNSATNDPRLLNFFVQLPYEIISRYFRTHHNRASGCRLFLYKFISNKLHSKSVYLPIQKPSANESTPLHNYIQKHLYME